MIANAKNTGDTQGILPNDIICRLAIAIIENESLALEYTIWVAGYGMFYDGIDFIRFQRTQPTLIS